MALFGRSEVTRVRVLSTLGAATLLVVLARLALFDVNAGNLLHPHGYCYLWQTDLVSAHVVSDSLIGLSYVAISATLIYLVWRGREMLPFSWIFVAFGAFIVACGATHFMEIWTLWQPFYWLSADVKIVTALASVATAVVLPPLVPKALTVLQSAGISEQRRLALESAHRELEVRVEARTAELREALARAEDANRSRDAFLASVSHELRTPLNAIVGWAHMLKSAAPDPAFLARGMEVIDRNARVQAQLVGDLLDLSRLSTAHMRLETGPVDLVRLVKDAMEVTGPAAAAKAITVRLQATPPSLAMVGDGRRLQQIAWNLLSNAVKFTPQDGRVDVAVRRHEGMAVLEVRDSGIGIDLPFLPRLFEPFSQQDSSSTRTHHGLGLGLSIARQLVELHGGTIVAESDGPGTGACFTVELPVRAALTATGQRPADTLPDLRHARLLVIDDERDARETLGLMLEHAGASVVVASSAAEALEHLHANPEGFDVVVSDLAMPERDGFGLIETIRQSPDPRIATLPAIAVSAYARDVDRDRALAAGFQDHVAKPVTTERLVQAIGAVRGTPAGGQAR